MKEIIEKLNKIKEEILLERTEGRLRLFSLIARNDLDGKWDILFSADWLEKTNSEKDLVYLITKLKSEFAENLDFLARILVGTPKEIFIKQFIQAIVERGELGGPEEVKDLFVSKDLTISGLFIIAIDSTDLDLRQIGTNEGPIAVKDF